MLQMLRGASEHTEMHEELEIPEEDSDEEVPEDVPAYAHNNVIDYNPEKIHPYKGAADATRKTIKIYGNDALFDFDFLPNYGVDELGEYIGVTAKHIQAINDNKGALKRALSEPVVALLHNRLIRNVRVARNGKKGTSDLFYEELVDICIKSTRVALSAQVNGHQMILYIRILILDGINLACCDVIHSVIHLVRRRVIPLSLLSVRETGLVQYKHNLDYITYQIERSGAKGKAASDRSKSPMLGIYLFGRKDSPGPQIRRLGSGGSKASNESVESRKIINELKKGSNSAAERKIVGDRGSSTMSVIGNQLGNQWQMLPAATASDANKSEDSSSTVSSAYPGHDWYRPAGEIIPSDSTTLHSWGYYLDQWVQTMKEHERNNIGGLQLAFDAVLCPGLRHNKKWLEYMHREEPHSKGKLTYLYPRIATVALGPDACDTCGDCPEEIASWPKSPVWKLPLLSPVPKFNPSVREAQRPWLLPERKAGADDGRGGLAGEHCGGGVGDGSEGAGKSVGEGGDREVKLIVRCKPCLVQRYQKRTGIWTCEYCWFAGVAWCPKFDA